MADKRQDPSNDPLSEPYDDRYGYGDARPDNEDLGYEDTDPYGYGEARPDSDVGYGYGDAKPDSDLGYGYGDARPDSDLGYEDAAPDGNYGDEDGDTYHTLYNDDKYSQGLHASHERNDDRNNDGNAMMQPDLRGKFISNSRTRSADWSVATAESYGDYGAGTDDDNDEGRDGGALPPRRTRYRRRGSVTKYSLETAETVKKEFEETSTILNQYRQGGGDASSEDNDPQEKQAVVMPSLMPDSFDFPIPHMSPEETGAETKKNEKKLKKGGRLRRFTMR